MALYDDMERSPYKERMNRQYPREGGRPRTLGGSVATTGSTATGLGGSGARTGGTGSGITATAQQGLGSTPYGGFLKSLTQPITSPYQSKFKEKAALLKEYTGGAYDTAAEAMRERLSSKQGLRLGESGIADTAYGRIQKGKAEALSRGYRGLMTEESQREQEMGLRTAGLELQRKLGGGSLALTGEEGAANRMMDYYRSKLGAEQAQWQPYWQGMSGGY
jgi:hypothetical protein